ncbi:hypothetical protein FBU30_002770 [Linnemannia zychae]|nr:hypothetical protein FBU30_002770 [Linnemannia zychae]
MYRSILSGSSSSSVLSCAFHSSATCPFRLLRSSQAAQQLLLKPTLDKETLLARSAELARIRIAKGLGSTSTITPFHRGTAQIILKATSATTAGESGAGAGAGALPKKSLWERAKKELIHYWHGTKLLGTEIKISTKLANRVLHGSKLSRREQRQLKRTSKDLLRLIPFSVFVIVPFMEFLLPVTLKLFPNMLPSTFVDSFAEEEKKLKLFKMRIEMAKFLQDTLVHQHTSTSAASSHAHTATEAATKREKALEEFRECFRKVWSTNTNEPPPSTAEMIRVTRLFGDELTIDNLNRPQLLSMCRYMNLNTLGTDRFLRYLIRTTMKAIHKDDELIMTEGVHSLTESELQAACQSRGINITDISIERLQAELKQWLDLHLTYSIPATILILSRTYSYSGSHKPDRPSKVLHATLSSLPNELLQEAELNYVEQGDGHYTTPNVDPLLKLKVLQHQEELIASEKAQEEEEFRKLCMEHARVQKEIELLERHRIAEELSAKAAPILLGPSYSSDTGGIQSTQHFDELAQVQRPIIKISSISSNSDRTLFNEPNSVSSVPTSHLTTTQLLELREALHLMISSTPVAEERVILESIKEQQAQQAKLGPAHQQNNISSFNDNATNHSSEEPGTITKITNRLLENRVKKMISKLDHELQAFETCSHEKHKPVTTNDRNELTIAEVEAALRIIKHKPDDETIKRIVKKLDICGDGLIQLDSIFALADVVEKEEFSEIIEDIVVFDGKELKKTDVLKDQ